MTWEQCNRIADAFGRLKEELAEQAKERQGTRTFQPRHSFFGGITNGL